ncbi:MAG: endolytic transglycosylase MltG [Candidatus Peregrinibacteria bacterium]|nr:endolytic transglycosylase MltG [Candidatus Peregrinibacteria bacterium]
MLRKLLLFLALALVGGYLWYAHALSAIGDGETRKIVKIPKGASMQSIATQLKEEGVIRSARAFSLYVRLHGEDSSLQAGSFVLRLSQSVSEIVETLTTGASEEISLTIPEGYTVKDIDALVAGEGLAETGAILTCAQTCDFSSFEFLPPRTDMAKRGGKIEGYLYPDTYYVSPADFHPKFFLERLLTTFRHRVVEEKKAAIDGSDRSLHAIITMASLIEEETRKAGERPIVSGILWKRFDNGIGLGVDAAVRYILEKPSSAITLDDLEVDSPYNLRKYRGLPPGPIASPSLSSIEAALAPEESKYLYYLHGTDGVIRYAETNDEHNENKKKYLR